MATITVLRPSSTSSGVGWSAVPSGTLHGVTSDNNDATYALWSGSGSALILATPVDTPPAGERRHQARVRARGEDGDAWWAVRLSSGALIAGAAGQFPTSPTTVTGSWGFGAPADGPTVLYTYVTGQSTGVKINELFLDVDSREAPTFTPQTLDGSGAVTVTISDTAQPTIRANAVDLDDLAARQYRYWVTLNGAIVWDTGVVSGPATDRQTTPLPNGSYVAHLYVWSTLSADTPYASDEETIAFTVSVGLVPAPDNPTVDPEDGTPFYRLEACAPYVGGFDGDVGYIEVQRVDCPLGGYLLLPGTGDSHASTPDPGWPPAVTVLYDFAATADGWVAEAGETVVWAATPVHDAPGSLQASKPMGVGPVALRFNDAHGALRDLTVDGDTITAWALVPTGAPGHDWTARLELQDPGFGWVQGPDTPLTPGTWTQLSFTPSPVLMASCRSIGIDWTGEDVGTTQPLFLDTVAIEGPGSPPAELQVTVTAQRDDAWFVPAGSFQTLAAQWDQNSDQGWFLMIFPGGRLAFSWSEDGSTPVTTALATDQPPIDPYGVVRARVRLLTDNGLGGWTVTFEAQADVGAPWTQVGDVITNSGGGTTSIFDSSAPYTVGAYMNTGLVVEKFTGRIYDVEVREGTTGTVIVSPDFTGHLDGTTTFSDDQGNVWTVHSPASITSPVSTRTVAILGPLATGECAEWVDFTLPRTGVGVTCDHAPEPCCSYYRARTIGRIDGDLRISDWSDAYDPGIPMGLIVMWPGTNASIPDGWNRVTELDGKYPKGVPNGSTEPGTTGGAGTHLHTVGTHLHDTSHAHTVTGNTGTATGTQVSTPNSAGATAVLSSHTHTRSAVNSATVVSGTTTPVIGTNSNEPARLDVLFIESDGTPAGVPDDAMAYMGDIAPAGWATYADATDRYPKGSAVTDGGTTAASSIAAHAHTIAAHSHTGTSHTHTSPSTGAVSSANTLNAGANPVLWQANHSHSVTIGSQSTAALSSGGSGNADNSSPDDPPHRNLRARQNTSGVEDLPVGVIGLWRGDLGAIPDFWQLCDGTNGTPDMFGRYARGATTGIGTTGGSLNPHSHTSPTHNHTTAGHAHTETVLSSGATTSNVSTTSTVTASTGTHTHSATDVNSTTPTVASVTSGTLASTTTEPPFEEVAFVQLVEEPAPPPTPSLFCLEWDDDLHLIRTTGPDGPIWAPVKGKFEWDVERPFTAASGVMGTRFVTSSPPGGRNLHLVAAVESEAELAELHAVLSRPLVLISPSDADEVWAAPVAESVRIIKIDRIRQVTADFIGTGPQPPPQLADVE